MSRENLMPRKSVSTSSFNLPHPWAPPPPPPPPSSSGGQPPSSNNGIELEERRGSLPLAQLKEEEEDFFQAVESGNVSRVERFLNEHRNLNINCINYKGQNALQIAIKKEDENMVKFLLRRPDLEVRDAALYAITTGNEDLTAIILDYIKSSDPENEMLGCPDSPNYSPEITPLILAAQCGDYKMVRMLLERDHIIEKPHLPSCLCATCKIMIEQTGTALSRIRLNSYRAISNPAYICQISDDPILYGFGLDRELKQCGLLNKEYRAEYEALAQDVRNFTVTLLTKCRDISEIEILLKLDWGYEGALGEIPFPRLQLALDNYQKEFVAHSMVQTILTSYWLGEFRSWPRLSLWEKSLRVLMRILFLPFICIGLIFIPQLKILKKWRAPLNRYLMSLASYIFFVFCVYGLNYFDTGKAGRGPPRTGFEGIVILYVIGFICSTMRQFWIQGRRRFLRIPWNWYDVSMEFIFFMCFVLWLKSAADAKNDIIHERKNVERMFWPHNDATLLHEGFFAIATILSFGKFAYYCLQSSRLGPLQVSMGKMAAQIFFFLILCFLIITSFAVPMARLYAYYTGMTQVTKDGSRSQLPSFSSFSAAFATFFWAMFCMAPVESPDVVISNLVYDRENPVINTHDFTEGVGKTLYAGFELMMVIALINTLIAILSNTFQTVVDNADVEFKFARTKLWMHFFHDSTVIPSPFNLIPSLSLLTSCYTYFKAMANAVPGAKAKFSFNRCCYIEYDRESPVDATTYQNLMSSLVQRYFREKEEESS